MQTTRMGFTSDVEFLEGEWFRKSPLAMHLSGCAVNTSHFEGCFLFTILSKLMIVALRMLVDSCGCNWELERSELEASRRL